MLESICVGVALSASCGLRLFLPLLAANLASRFGLITFDPSFHWLYGDDATLLLVVASAIEIISFYIPFIDNLLDVIAVPSSAIAGTIISTSIIPLDNYPAIQWGLGIIAGGGVAGTIQAGTSLIRVASTKFTLGHGNFVVTTIENILAFVIIIFAFVIPIIIVLIIAYFVVKILKKVFKRKGNNYGEFSNI